jgi:glycerophosphoryl diester phosphodiesterase
MPEVLRPSRPAYSQPSCDLLPAENTIAAFDYALSNGCDGFEFDVRYTRDGRSVLCHDADHNGRELAITNCSDLDDSLPFLEEVLTRFAHTAYLDIELKASGNEERIVAALRAHPPQCGYVVSSFLPEVLFRLREIGPLLPLGYICKDREKAERWIDLPIASFIPHHSLVSQRLVHDVHARGLQLLAWTVNRQRELLRLASWGVDGLISDDPKLLAATFPKAAATRAS